MSEELGSYLNDHLAGSVVALQTIAHLISATGDKPEFQNFFMSLETDIESDQNVLQQMIAAIGHAESGVKKAASWGVEKISWLKFEISGTSSLGLLEALESLVLGITGKRSLWQLLESVKSTYPALKGFDFSQLIQRAADQCESVNRHRMAVGKEIFTSTDCHAASSTSALS